MKTEKLYYDYASAAPFNAEILELRPGGFKSDANGNAQPRFSLTQVILDKTIFYPEGGGQPADRGTINGVPLLDIREKNGEILHLVESPGGLMPGPAELVLDSKRRRDMTTQHTGQHLLSGTILRVAGKPTVSVHFGDETGTIDVDAVEMSEELLLAVEDAVNDAIEENLPVIIHLCPPEDITSFPLRKFPPQGEEVIRVVEIKGHDFSPCCGTHLKSTAEIGILRILGAEKYKGMTRITFIIGRRVLLDSRLLRHNAGIISRSLSVPVNETGKAVFEFLEKTANLERRLKTLEAEAAQTKAQALCDKASLLQKAEAAADPPDRDAGPALLVETYTEAGIDEVLAIGKIAQKKTEAALVLVSERDLKFAAFCAASAVDLRPLIKEAFEAQGGRGGGSPSFFQGSFGTKEALNAFLLALKK